MDELTAFLKDKTTLIIGEVNRFYLSGMRSSLGYLFLSDGRKILYVDGRYIEAAKKAVFEGVEVRLLSKLSEAVAGIVREFKVETLYCETDLTVCEYERLKEMLQVPLIASQALSDLILNLRAVKSQKELSFVISAQRAAEKAFGEILNFIKPGVTERRLKLELEYKMQLWGAEGMSFETIAISGKNTSKPHGVPTEKPIEAGDFVTMDFGATVGGYCSDMTRTVAVGHATDEMILCYNTVLRAQETGIAAIKPGALCRDVDKAARTVIEKAGFGDCFNHSTGHGVGLEIHEQPNLSARSESRLSPGNIVTCEPGIYLEDRFGVRIEDMLFVTQNGAQNLTDCQKNLIILK